MPEIVAGESPFSHTARQMNKIMDQLQKGFFAFSPNETWTPSVNVYESDTHYVVCVDLAGLEKEKIDLSVVDNQLRLRGARPVPDRAGSQSMAAEAGQEHSLRWRVHLMEIDHGNFVREVELPQNVDQTQIQASYKNGLLWIELPKKQ